MSKMPLISIVTPSFNCATYIRDCIESVLAQNYKKFEHIIIDGNSQDGTVEILQEYPHLTWCSEPDSGEAEAVNKALRLARGEIIGWLNADDCYVGGVFHRVAKEIDPQENRHVVCARTHIVDDHDSVVRVTAPHLPCTLPRLVRWFDTWMLDLAQPGIFYSQALVRDVGFFREDCPFAIDYEYWLRAISRGYQFHCVDQVFANARLVRLDGKSAIPLQARQGNFHKAARSYLGFLSLGEQFSYWKDYFAYRYSHGWIRTTLQEPSWEELRLCWNALRESRSQALIHLCRAMLLFPPNAVSKGTASLVLRLCLGFDTVERLRSVCGRGR